MEYVCACCGHSRNDHDDDDVKGCTFMISHNDMCNCDGFESTPLALQSGDEVWVRGKIVEIYDLGFAVEMSYSGQHYFSKHAIIKPVKELP